MAGDALPSTSNAEAAAVLGAATALATAGAAGLGGAVGAAGAGAKGAEGSAFPNTARAAEEDKVALGSVDNVDPTALLLSAEDTVEAGDTLATAAGTAASLADS